MSTATAASDTAERILDIATRLVQTRGFNAFSYADVAAAVGVTKASLHYHFASKAKLGERMVARYQEAFLECLSRIDRTSDGAPAKLAAYIAIYAKVLEDGRMCLCGMLAAEHETLPETVQSRLREFFEANETWLTAVLREGKESGRIAFSGGPPERARLMVSALEGAMLLARSHGDPERFRSAAAWLMSDLGIGDATVPSKSGTRRSLKASRSKSSAPAHASGDRRRR